jgi:lysophospholipase L1-like esterase
MVYNRALTNDATPLWDFRVQPQVVLINLGTNDISNNKGDPGMPFRDAYLAFVGTVRSRYPNALIVCLIGPLLSGTDLTAIQTHIRSVVSTRNAAGDANIEYFAGIAQEVETAPVGVDYWKHIEHRVFQFEKMWKDRAQSQAGNPSQKDEMMETK